MFTAYLLQTRIMTTQSTTYLKYADKVVLLDKGQIVSTGSLKEVQESPAGKDFFKNLQQNNQNNDDTCKKTIFLSNIFGSKTLTVFMFFEKGLLMCIR